MLELTGRAEITLFGKGINLRKAAYNAFIAMQKAAQADGLALQVVSGYRSFNRQKRIWTQKYRHYTQVENLKSHEAIQKIIAYSTIPGTSRHHWGTDLDIIEGNTNITGDVLLAENFETGGPFAEMKQWLDKNSEKFGFHLVYTDDPCRKGFKHEPWHYSYAPLACPMLTAYQNLNLFQLLQDIKLPGYESFTTNFIQSYIQYHIMDINPSLR